MDRARPVRVPGQALQRAVREPLAAPVPEAASADLDPVARQQGDHRLGFTSRPALYLSADLQPLEGGGALPQDVPRYLPGLWLRGQGFAAWLGCSCLCR